MGDVSSTSSILVVRKAHSINLLHTVFALFYLWLPQNVADELQKSQNSVDASVRKWNEVLVAIKGIERNIYRETDELIPKLRRKVAPPVTSQPLADQEFVPALESELARFNGISQMIPEIELKRGLVQAKILKASEDIHKRVDELEVPFELNKLTMEERKKLVRQWKEAETFIVEMKTTFEGIKKEWEETLEKFEDELEGSTRSQCALC
ncbi:Peripheral-type benzodiazepine receptor-associated protein 1 [Orchesella cincta]|uniref:Peripheral-type benzodiazepine receptor-associated protein 1 n=1 Tax=Orchesella cincta TaxID=48709 RepID=A0A1D2N1Z4_ORCCI|nr:Peripheral-type benzodiazepine receptor-associated protein 1 [Orchesella cincta]